MTNDELLRYRDEFKQLDATVNEYKNLIDYICSAMCDKAVNDFYSRQSIEEKRG